MHLSSAVVRKCDSSSSERQSTKVLLQNAVPTWTAFEGRKIILIKEKNKSLRFLFLILILKNAGMVLLYLHHSLKFSKFVKLCLRNSCRFGY